MTSCKSGKIEYEKRRCPICDVDEADELHVQKGNVHNYQEESEWEFENHVVICRRCGMVYVSPAPTEHSLCQYYNSQLTVFESESSFNIEKRMHILKQLCAGMKEKQLIYAEVGANDSDAFHQQVAKLFASIITIDINESSRNTYTDIRKCKEKADVIGAYFVFEHIVNLKESFSLCYEMLKENGYLVIEVPNLDTYYHYNHLMEIYEHVNHFTAVSLISVACTNGFSPVYMSRAQCSREEGIVFVLQKNNQRIRETSLVDGIKEATRLSFFEASQIYEKKDKHMMELAAHINNYRDMQVTIWCANDLSKGFLESYEKEYGALKALFIDEDKRKSAFFQGKKIFTSQEARAALEKSEIVFIFSPIRYKVIKHHMEQMNISAKVYYIDDLYQLHLI